MTKNNFLNTGLYHQIGAPLYKWDRGYHLTTNQLELENVLLHDLVHQFRNRIDHQLKRQWEKKLII